MVEEELHDRHDGERLVKINLSSPLSDGQSDVNNCNAGKLDTCYSKSVLKISNSSESCIQVMSEKTRSVGFKLDKECQTDESSHEQESKYTSAISQTSTDDDDITSRCSCFDDQHSETSRTHVQITNDACFPDTEHLEYIDSNQEDLSNSFPAIACQRGFDQCSREKYSLQLKIRTLFKSCCFII